MILMILVLYVLVKKKNETPASASAQCLSGRVVGRMNDKNGFVLAAISCDMLCCLNEVRNVHMLSKLFGYLDIISLMKIEAIERS